MVFLCVTGLLLIWKTGAIALVRKTVAAIREAIVLRGRLTPVAASAPVRRWLYLAPAALVAVLIVRWDALAR